jgi:predicted dienelactone hydrolase
MRPLEILISLLLAVYLLWPLGGNPLPAAVRLLPSLAIAATVFHLILEKFRWQMVPLYGVSGILVSASMLDWNRQGAARPLGWPLAGLALGLLILAAATALPALLPVPHAPTPTGPYKVGTVTYVLSDGTRRELYSGKDEPRRFVIQVWYPARPVPGAQPAPWMPGARRLARLISAWIRMPFFFLDHLSLVQSHSYPEAPLEQAGVPYPVLVFSHGWGGFRAQNAYQTQELASHGYVVVGMEHPYGSMVTVFGDGQVAHNNPAALPYNDPRPEYLPAARRLADQWAGDIGYALDQLARLHKDDPQGRLTGALDMDKIGLFGHSTGAGAVVQFSGTDPRCKAGFAEDVYLAPVSERVLESGLPQPFAFMFCQVWAEDKAGENNQAFHHLESHLAAPHAAMHILGTTHYDFTDLPALSPLAHALGLKGPIRGSRVHRIINDYSLAFFDLYLRGKPSELFDGPSPGYPEVIFRV